MTIVRVDEKQRVRLPQAKPGQIFSIEANEGRIVLVEVIPKEIPLVKSVRVKGKLRPPPGFRPSKDLIAAAVRADRDAR